ncbi:MAG: hypothetical protein ACRDM7_12025 [Thermoleophilaceae bacterium]
MALRNTYSPTTKATVLAVLASNGGNVKRTVRELAAQNIDVPRSTVRDWARDPESVAPEELRAQAADQLGAMLEIGTAKYALLLVHDEFIAHLAARSPQHVATNFGILFDKHRLLFGKPTQILGGEPWVKLLEELRAGVKPAPPTSP